jgi:hypothetical protein
MLGCILKTQKYVQQNTGSGATSRAKPSSISAVSKIALRRTGHAGDSPASSSAKLPLYLNGSRLDTVGEWAMLATASPRPVRNSFLFRFPQSPHAERRAMTKPRLA